MATRADYLDAMWGATEARRRIEARPRAAEPVVEAEPEEVELTPPGSDPQVRFPILALPGPIADFALEVSASFEVEPEIVILPALAALSVAIGNSRRIRLKRDWIESAMLWIAIVAETGSLKTPALMAATKPLQEREQDWAEEHDHNLERFDAELLAWEHDRHSERGLKPTQPTGHRLTVDDPTMEELIYILRDNERGVALVQDELVAWVSGMNQYKSGGRGSDRAKWLKFWSSAPVAVDRRAEHGRPVRVWRPFIAVAGGIQPTLLQDLRPEGGRQDGFIERILYGWPGSRVRHWTDRTVSEATERRYDAVFDGLLGLHMEPDPKGRPWPVLLDLDDQAHLAWVDFYNQHHNEMASPDLDPRLRGSYAKLDGYAARLSLVVHLTRQAAGETDSPLVDLESVEDGWAIAEYFRDGAKRVYGQLDSTEQDKLILDLVAWLRARQVTEISLRECMIARRPGFKTSDAGKSIFKAAQARGYGKQLETPAGFRLNGKAKGGADAVG